ncbi:DUF4089 domain-containing protein [Haliea sp. E17]|uniref:DUF4089 domain-containing protein n=1 Tax=Haliea sp. E17 TaxID=3401576 RepID=UPI003AAB03C4
MQEITLDMLAAFAAAAGVAVPEEYRDGVLTHLRVAQAMAAKVHAAPLHPDELALAPVFTPWVLPDTSCDA